MDTFGGMRAQRSTGAGSVSFLSFDEHASSVGHPDEHGRVLPRLSSTFGDGEERTSTIAGSSYLEMHQEHSDEDRVDIPTPVSFFDTVEAQHKAKIYDQNAGNESIYESEPSEAGTEDIEAALHERTEHSLGLAMGHLRSADEHLGASRGELHKPEEDIRAPSLSEVTHDSPIEASPAHSEDHAHSNSSHSAPAHSEDHSHSHSGHSGSSQRHGSEHDNTPEATPTMPYRSLDRTKPITNLTTPRRTFFKADRSRGRDLSLIPGTSDNIKIKGEVIPQETFEKLRFASASSVSVNRPSTAAQSVISVNTLIRPKSKASTAPSIYSKESANRSATRLIGDDGQQHRPSPGNMSTLDGMVAIHLEAEKERIKRIAKGVIESST
jgi:hypothetical protein